MLMPIMAMLIIRPRFFSNQLVMSTDTSRVPQPMAKTPTRVPTI